MILFLHGCHNLYFRRNHVADVYYFAEIMSPMYIFWWRSWTLKSFRRTFIIRRLHRRLICFPSNLHVTGFSSWRITSMIHSFLVWFLWWLRQGAIGPIEATPVGVNVDWIELRIYTFELVIRLSKVKQLAFPFCTVFQESRCSCGPMRTLRDAFFTGMPCWTVRNSCLSPQPKLVTSNMLHVWQGNRHVLFLQVWSLWYLVRWNMLCT